MNIISIEVIRHNNPGVAVGVVVGEKITIQVGDTVRVHMTVDYNGPAVDGAVWTAIGWADTPFGFIELANKRTPFHFDESTEFVTYDLVCDIPVTDISGYYVEFSLYGSTLDMYAKIMEVPGDDIFTPTYQGVIDFTLEAEYKLIQHTIHPAAYVYEGESEICTIEFPLTPEQFPFTQWGGLKLAEAIASNVESEGSSLLEVWVDEDTTPMFWTNYRVRIKAAVASEEQGVAVWPWLVGIGAVLKTLPWSKIVTGTLVVLGIWLIGWIIEKLITSIDKILHKPSALTDEIIDSLGREDLIPMILYKAPRVDYEVSPEELEAMTDDGLRALLKELRDRQAPGIGLGMLVAIGAVGVVGVGVALAMAPRTPKK